MSVWWWSDLPVRLMSMRYLEVLEASWLSIRTLNRFVPSHSLMRARPDEFSAGVTRGTQCSSSEWTLYAISAEVDSDLASRAKSSTLFGTVMMYLCLFGLKPDLS